MGLYLKLRTPTLLNRSVTQYLLIYISPSPKPPNLNFWVHPFSVFRFLVLEKIFLEFLGMNWFVHGFMISRNMFMVNVCTILLTSRKWYHGWYTNMIWVSCDLTYDRQCYVMVNIYNVCIVWIWRCTRRIMQGLGI